jgi:hypothetical protein
MAEIQAEKIIEKKGWVKMNKPKLTHKNKLIQKSKRKLELEPIQNFFDIEKLPSEVSCPKIIRMEAQ